MSILWGYYILLVVTKQIFIIQIHTDRKIYQVVYFLTYLRLVIQKITLILSVLLCTTYARCIENNKIAEVLLP